MHCSDPCSRLSSLRPLAEWRIWQRCRHRTSKPSVPTNRHSLDSVQPPSRPGSVLSVCQTLCPRVQSTLVGGPSGWCWAKPQLRPGWTSSTATRLVRQEPNCAKESLKRWPRPTNRRPLELSNHCLYLKRNPRRGEGVSGSAGGRRNTASRKL